MLDLVCSQEKEEEEDNDDDDALKLHKGQRDGLRGDKMHRRECKQDVSIKRCGMQVNQFRG